ncbi:MAG: Putative Fe-S oxidoreductase [Clostridiales bacterium 38_11]|nr:MAG: Putative Fe-S oxidoreductase [Clostridiales bacterium 38_11]HBH13689.1 TIGR01212 family radical SAM protein [Clostridiales bacterium]
MFGNLRYRTLSYELEKTFGEKIIKLSVNGGFTCPNRDGTKGYNGCIFCSGSGGGDFAGNPERSITKQIEKQIALLSRKWKSDRYIVYFGTFTSTYGNIDELRKKYYEALDYPGVIGLAISTRADCLSEEVVMLLEEINRQYYLWVEIGLQTVNHETADLIRRGYDLELFEDRFNRLKTSDIKVVLHLILGLPGEKRDDILKTIDYISYIIPWGVKLHLLHVIKNTDLEAYYNLSFFVLMEMDEYVDLVCDCVERLPESIVLHRITGDGKKSDLVGPLWSLNKLKVISEINREMVLRNSIQGCKYEPKHYAK